VISLDRRGGAEECVGKQFDTRTAEIDLDRLLSRSAASVSPETGIAVTRSGQQVDWVDAAAVEEFGQ
jgi:hypothetical protein